MAGEIQALYSKYQQKYPLYNKEKIVLSEKTKKVYNILGDYPDVIAKFMVKGILANNKNNVKFDWLTNRKAAWRVMTSSFNKRDFFKALDKSKE